MNWLARFLVITAASTILALASPAYSNTFYPNRGWFWYDGCYHAVSHFWWDYPGGWSVPDPKYEHDFSMEPDYFDGCTSWTDLPNPYDDCPTAGTLEPSGLKTFSFGSFHVLNIQAGAEYMGAWDFWGGTAPDTYYQLSGQENTYAWCSYDNIWCMGSTQTYRVTFGMLYFGLYGSGDWGF